MTLTKLFDPSQGKMRVVGLMSGSGSNLRRILQVQHANDLNYEVVAIFTDNPDSNAESIGEEFGVPVIVQDIAGFYRRIGQPRSNLEPRKVFDIAAVHKIRDYAPHAAAYAGYMSIATEPLVKAFLGVNVHPADLSIEEGGVRKFTGNDAVLDAILAGETRLRSSTHIIEPQVDGGRLLRVSDPFPVELPQNWDPSNKEMVRRVADHHQDTLKECGDWVVFPQTLFDLSEGLYSEDESGLLYYEGRPIPHGVKR